MWVSGTVFELEWLILCLSCDILAVHMWWTCSALFLLSILLSLHVMYCPSHPVAVFWWPFQACFVPNLLRNASTYQPPRTTTEAMPCGKCLAFVMPHARSLLWLMIHWGIHGKASAARKCNTTDHWTWDGRHICSIFLYFFFHMY